MITDEDWVRETHWRLNRVTEFFRPTELRAILDFIRTAGSERERAATEPGVSGEGDS